MFRAIRAPWPRLLLSLILVAGLTGLTIPHSDAQTTTGITSTAGAGSMGTTVTQAGNTYQITGGVRPGSGPNLFHSFGEFGVPTNTIANFMNDTALPTSNILGRVTGGNPSNIFGTIQTTGFGSANLFLMNPAGIVFGPNASLNVGGSASFTTADYLRFTNGTQFHALPGPQDTSLSSAPVASFGFLGSNPGSITVQGSQLAVAPGQTLSLVGGNITVQGVAVEEGAAQPVQLSAPGGRINLASVASPGEILAENLEPVPNLNGQSFGALGIIQIMEKAALDSSGYDGGAVRIRGGRLVVDDSTISANVTGPPLEQSGHADTGIDVQMTKDVLIQNLAVLETNVTDQASAGIGSGGVRVKANRIEIVGDADLETFPFTGIRSLVNAESAGGRSGDILLEADSIQVRDLGGIQTLTLGVADAGNIVVRTNETLRVDNLGLVISGSTEASGNAGDIELTSRHGDILLSLSDISTSTFDSSGNTGKLSVSAVEGDIVLNESSILIANRGTGTLGDIEVTAHNLQLSNLSSISGDNIGPPLQPTNTQIPGNISVTLTGRLSLEGEFTGIETVARGTAPAADLTISAPEIRITEASRLSTETRRSGSGGQLTLHVNDLQLASGGQIRSGSVIPRNFRGQVTGAPPSGAGGTINIQGLASPATSVVIDGPGSGVFTNAEGAGAGGTINLSAQSLTIQNSGIISASTSGTAPSATGGTIAISAGRLVSLNNGGTITASSTGPANAGNIAINAGAQFLNQNGSVTTQASQASGGNILIQATDSIRLINSQLSTSVQGGPNTTGGNIMLDPAVVTLQNSQVTAQAVQGQGGNINIIAGTFLFDPTSIVSASSQFGLSGTVNIQSPVSSLSNTLATLPQRPLQAQQLLSQRCAAQVSGHLSSLVVAGRDTLPIEPGGWLMSPMAFWANEIPSQEAQPAAGHSLAISEQSQVLAGQLSQQLGPSPQRGVSDRATSCGS